jgi:hypothetical protein
MKLLWRNGRHLGTQADGERRSTIEKFGGAAGLAFRLKVRARARVRTAAAEARSARQDNGARLA